MALACAFAFPFAAFPCECGSTNSCISLGGANWPLFLGTVVAVADLPEIGTRELLSSRSVRFRIDESFRGLPEGLREIEVWTGLGGGDCGLRFRAGDRYLIDAFTGKDGIPRVGLCSDTSKLEYARPQLALLRLQQAGKRLPSLIGLLAQHDRDFQGRFGQQAPKALGDSMVRVKANGKTYETRSDAEGIYQFYGLPAGKYEFDPKLPRGTKLSSFLGSDSPPEPVQLGANHCLQHDIAVFPSGSIQGRVLDAAGQRVRHAHVYIVPATQELPVGNSNLYWESLGKEGFFQFVHLPPGRYILVVNPEDETRAGFPYRTTFYPGVRNRADALLITVQSGAQIKNADIHLADPLNSSREKSYDRTR